MLTQSYGRTLFLMAVFLSLICTGFQTFGCLEFWAEEGDSASDVFIQFVQEHLGKNWSQKMNAKKYGYRSHSTPWEQEIIPSTRQWSPKKAREFLNILVSRVGPRNTCYLLARALSHLKNIPHQRKISQDILQNFKERLAFYDDYMGEEATTEMMRKALAGLTQGPLVKIKELTQFLEDFFGSKEPVIVVFTRDPHTYSITRVNEIQPGLNLLEALIGHKTLTAMMARKKEDSKYGRYLSIAKLRVLQIILQPLINEITVVSLKRKNSTQKELLELVELNYDHLFRIQKQVDVWIAYSGISAVARVMKKSLEILFEPGLYEIENKIKMAEKKVQSRQTVTIFAQQNAEFFVISSVREFSESFQQWVSPPLQKPDTNKQQKPKQRTVRNLRNKPVPSSQMILSFPE